jgi:hypothetical protein
MHNTSMIRRRLPLLLAALVAAVTLAACGSSANTKSASSSASTKPASTTSRAAFAKYTACLKSHGVTLPAGGHFGRPGGAGAGGAGAPTGGAPTGGAPPTGSGSTPAGGGGLFNGGGAAGARGGFASNPKDKAAITACASELPKGAHGGFAGRGGFAGGGANAAKFKAEITKYRTEYDAAVTTFAACVTAHGYKMPKPDFTTGAAIFPASVDKNAKFEAVVASKKCPLKTPPRPTFRFGGGAPGGGGGAPGA